VRKQQNPFFEFWWAVAKGGYEWVKTKPSADAHTELLLVPRSAATSEYPPLKKYTGLFREFLAVKPTPKGVLAFANRYGQLGIEKRMDASNEPRARFGELLSDWCLQIQAMQKMVALWDWVQANEPAQIAPALGIAYGGTNPEGEQLIHLFPGGPRDDPTERHYGPRSADPFRPEEMAGRVLAAIATQVNARLTGAEVSPQLLHDRQLGKLVMHVVPHSLLGALWFQFARTIDGEKEHRRCGGCKQWFEVSPGQGRTDKEYCSGACRARAYRQRQEQARELRAKGQIPKHIAKEMDVELEQVRRWLKPSKHKD
jgi:hypothetical protein